LKGANRDRCNHHLGKENQDLRTSLNLYRSLAVNRQLSEEKKQQESEEIRTLKLRVK
jgi:hypothetical protein